MRQPSNFPKRRLNIELPESTHAVLSAKVVSGEITSMKAHIEKALAAYQVIVEANGELEIRQPDGKVRKVKIIL